MADESEPAIRVSGLKTEIGGKVLHEGLDLEMKRGEVLGVVGASGAGKSVLLRTIIGLNSHAAGTIEILGRDVDKLDEDGWRDLRMHFGVLFQDGALFSSLTVGQNIQVAMNEFMTLDPKLRDEITVVKNGLVGLSPDTIDKFPSELSGGMRKRAALARALALEPELLFLDEPTAGLDPISAAEFDSLMRNLQQALGLSVFLVTHDLDSLVSVCDRIAVLVDKKVVVGTLEEHMANEHPWIKAYFHGPRGRAAQQSAEKKEKKKA
ncbi:MAG: ATP-binding cassette domain-containing protein [Alphaproteobacteria bacterium]|nr:ATP-binding cassette domain-containing protein [Alphaproteobacteria bacterium]